MDIHPFATHFPIVLVLLLCGSECFVAPFLLHIESQRSAQERAIYFLIFKLLAALFIVVAALSFFSGLQAAAHTAQAPQMLQDAVAVHYQWGRWIFFGGSLLALAGCFIDKLYEDNLIKQTYRWLLVILCAATLYTGALGGGLVFEHGVGVKLLKHTLDPVRNTDVATINTNAQ
jgi:uncharacterized membrane protein